MDEIKDTNILGIKKDGDVLIVSFKQASISGIGEMEQISETLQDSIRNHHTRKMIIDFSNVCFFSSQMLGLLVNIWRKIKDMEGTLLISGINPQLTRVFRITHLDKLFDFYDDMEAAVSALRTS
ncbi:MAG: STAS domain-containing protein [Planctomycetota bacterium]